MDGLSGRLDPTAPKHVGGRTFPHGPSAHAASSSSSSPTAASTLLSFDFVTKPVPLRAWHRSLTVSEVAGFATSAVAGGQAASASSSSSLSSSSMWRSFSLVTKPVPLRSFTLEAVAVGGSSDSGALSRTWLTASARSALDTKPVDFRSDVRFSSPSSSSQSCSRIVSMNWMLTLTCLPPEVSSPLDECRASSFTKSSGVIRSSPLGRTGAISAWQHDHDDPIEAQRCPQRGGRGGDA
mmetsp:Transcript_26243/g.78455  ORF Transcript_26243/g.78455 Transcript_26243/m.78455 type:complete len:238 (+) Transcript_26243:84-797(+)